MNFKKLKQAAGIQPFASRITLVGGFSPCPFHRGDGDKTFHVLVTDNNVAVGTCFSRCGKTWDAISFVKEFDRVSTAEAVSRIQSAIDDADIDDLKIIHKTQRVPMTAETWKTRGRPVNSEDVAKLAASRPQSVTPSAETLNSLGFKMTANDFLVCPYRLGDTFYTIKGRRVTKKDFLQENAISQQALFNIDRVT